MMLHGDGSWQKFECTRRIFENSCFGLTIVVLSRRIRRKKVLLCNVKLGFER